MSQYYSLLVCNPDGLSKTTKGVAKSDLTILFESSEYHGGWKLWVFGRASESQIEKLESSLPKKSARGYLLSDGGFQTLFFAGLDGALSENVFKVGFLRTQGLKFKEALESTVLKELEENAERFFQNATRSLNEGVVTFRVDSVETVNGVNVVDGAIGFSDVQVFQESDYYNVYFNAQGKLLRKGGLDSFSGDFCGPNVVISFELPSGEEGVVDPEESGLRWL